MRAAIASDSFGPIEVEVSSTTSLLNGRGVSESLYLRLCITGSIYF